MLTESHLENNLANDLKKVAKGAGISLFGTITGRVLWFLCQIVIARLFGAEVFGLYILGITVLKLTELLARLGLHTGAMRFVSIYRKDNPEKVKGVLITSLSVSFLNGIVLGSILYLLAGIVSQSVFNKPELRDIIRAFAFCVPFMASMMVVATASRGFHTTKYAVYIRDIIQPSSNLLLILILTYIGLGISGIIYAFIVSCIIAMIVGVFLTTRIFPDIKDKTLKPVYELKELISYSIPLVFTGFLHFLLSWTDAVMLGIMKTLQDVGIYKAAVQVPLLLGLILVASNSIYAPVIAALFHKGEKERMERIFKTTTRWIYTIALPASLILLFSAREVMSIFGASFVEKGVPVLMLFTIAQFINCITGGAGFTLVMTGRQKMEFANSLALVLINIILNLLLIPRYGTTGAAIALAASVVLINILRLAEVYKLYQIHPYSRSYLRTFIPAIVSILLLLMVQLLELGSVWNIVANIIVVGLAFSAYTGITGFDENEKYIFELVRAKLVAKMGVG